MDINPKILIVDDRPENLVALEVILRDLDVDLVKAGSGNEALKATLYNDFALALLDIQMPEMDGYELAGILREEEKTAHLPFIFISAIYTDYINVFKGYEKGAFSYITKPFQPEILLNKVKFFIEKHQQEIALHRLNENLEEKNVILKQLNDNLKDKNSDLETINKELESFTYSISHDLRAPLRAINGYARILRETYEHSFDAEGEYILKRISLNAMQMGDMIDSLLNLSRLGRRKIKKNRVDMRVLLHEVLEEVKGADSNPNTQVIVRDIHSAQGDAELLRQVLVNLVANAFKYSGKKEDPVIEIGASVEGPDIVYYIKDNGVGFDMKYSDKLFGVFQRLHGPAEFEGTGIGLAIVKRIVMHHGGRVWADAEIDKGASFYFTLPVEA